MSNAKPKPSTFVDFKTVKSAVSIEAILERYELLADLDPKDDGYTGDCPFHEGESRRPFHVSLSKNAWYCFSCEEGGNILDFVARMETVSIKKAAQLLVSWFEVKSALRGPKRQARASKSAKAAPKPAELNSEPLSGSHESRTESLKPAEEAASADSGQVVVNRPLGFSLKNLEPSHELLQPLGFDRTTVDFFEAGYCSKGMMEGRLAIPIHSGKGELLAYAGKALDGEGGYRYPPKFHRSLELYNLHRAIEPALEIGLILVADILDVWRLAVAGHPNAVGLMDNEINLSQEALITSLSTRTQRLLVLWPESAARDAIVARLAFKFYVKAMDLREFLV